MGSNQQSLWGLCHKDRMSFYVASVIKRTSKKSNESWCQIAYYCYHYDLISLFIVALCP